MHYLSQCWNVPTSLATAVLKSKAPSLQSREILLMRLLHLVPWNSLCLSWVSPTSGPHICWLLVSLWVSPLLRRRVSHGLSSPVVTASNCWNKKLSLITCLCVHMCTQVQAPAEARGVGTELAGGCEPPDVSANNQTQVFWKSNAYSWPLSNFSSHLHEAFLPPTALLSLKCLLLRAQCQFLKTLS